MQEPHTRQNVRTTIYLQQEELALLDEMKAFFRRRYGRPADRSQLIREAIRNYHVQLTDARSVVQGEGQ